jgi:predicted Zn-dependent protease
MRVQNAFAAMMQANESLKSQESRDVYDYRMRKELAEIENAKVQSQPADHRRDGDEAAANFDRGFTLMMDNDVAAAIPYLARAVHYAPKVAKYHSYYGKALSSDRASRHKAEGEMQAAIKIEPDNPTFRLMLAEFFIDVGLMKRAEGELNRLLAIFPSNREAQTLLASLQKPSR